MVARNEKPRIPFKTAALAGLAGVAIGASTAEAPVAAEAKPAAQISIKSIEQTNNKRLADNKTVSTANGTLTYTVTSKNPYTGEPVTTTLVEKNPLIASISKNTKLRPDHNKLTIGKYAFGYINIMTQEPTTHFLKYDPNTMKFTPATKGHQIRQVKFADVQINGNSLGSIDYEHPLQPNGKPYPNGETFCISAPLGTNPRPVPPQL